MTTFCRSLFGSGVAPLSCGSVVGSGPVGEVTGS